MQEKYLPIGSIIKLKNNNHELMITGYYGMEYTDEVKTYDYEGIAYPEGTLFKNSWYAFNHDDIAEVVFKGFEDSKYTLLNNKLLGKNEESIDTLDKEVPLIDIKYDSLEEDSSNIFSDINSEPIQDLKEEINDITNEEEIPEKKEEIVIPHYTFDENGIIIG